MFENIKKHPIIFFAGATLGSLGVLIAQALLLTELFAFSPIEAGRLAAGLVLVVFIPCGNLCVNFHLKHNLGFKWFYERTFGGNQRAIFVTSYVLIAQSVWFSWVFLENYRWPITPLAWLVVLFVFVLTIPVLMFISKYVTAYEILTTKESRLLFLGTTGTLLALIFYFFTNLNHVWYPFLRYYLIPVGYWIAFILFKWAINSDEP